MKAILVMLSNYFHDLAVGILFCSMLLTWYVHKANLAYNTKPANNLQVLDVINNMGRVALFAWIWIIVGGVIRTVNYYDYEWLPAAGRGQVAALVVKHILLAAITVAGAIMQARINRLYPRGKKEPKEGRHWA